MSPMGSCAPGPTRFGRAWKAISGTQNCCCHGSASVRKTGRPCSTIRRDHRRSGRLSSRSFIPFLRWRLRLCGSRPRLRAIENLREQLLSRPSQDRATLARITLLADAIRQSVADIAALVRRLTAIAQSVEHMVHAMDFTFLFDPTRKLLSIGYRVPENSLDPSCYDLLASEARLASFIAIAKGDVPSSHWFHLGRALTPVEDGSALVSWSGSIFEYLMPALVMRFPAGSLLCRTYELIVRRQIQYGLERGVPWGVSESAYNARDLDLTYQYSSFGVPGLGLKRGLSEDVVVAPYATALAAMINPMEAVQGFGAPRRGRRGGNVWVL